MHTLVSWLRCNWEDRKKHVAALLKKVHFDKVPKDMLQEMVTDDILEELQSEETVLKSVMHWMQDGASPASNIVQGNTITVRILLLLLLFFFFVCVWARACVLFF